MASPSGDREGTAWSGPPAPLLLQGSHRGSEPAEQIPRHGGEPGVKAEPIAAAGAQKAEKPRRIQPETAARHTELLHGGGQGGTAGHPHSPSATGAPLLAPSSCLHNSFF